MNVIHSEAEKKFKYKYISIEFQRIWNKKFLIVPVITGATGIVSRSLKNLEITAGQHSIDFREKTAVLGTSHIIRKVPQAET
jgi:hypothetical protein